MENHRVLLDDVGRRKWDRLPPGSVPWRCGVLPVIRHSGLPCSPPCQGPRHLRGTVPSPPYQGPRHLWLGTEAPPLCRLCGCSDHGEGVVHAGSAAPILVPPRMAATWSVPPLCQRPRHLQERASVLVGAFAPLLAPRSLIRALGT